MTELQAVKRFDAASGAQKTFYCLRCCKCGAEGLVARSNLKNSMEGMAERIVGQSLRRDGWDIGNNLKKPICPKCVKAEDIRRSESRARVQLQETREMAEPKISLVPDPPKAEPPPKRGLHDNKRIMRALDDAYDLDNTVYFAGQSDDKVANALNVPVAWVKEVRENFYGPAMSAEVAALLPEISRIEARIAEHGKTVQRVAAEHAALVNDLSALKARIGKAGL